MGTIRAGRGGKSPNEVDSCQTYTPSWPESSLTNKIPEGKIMLCMRLPHRIVTVAQTPMYVHTIPDIS